MNKEIFDALPAEEQPTAEKLSSISESMKVLQHFQWTLESQLMDAYKSKSQSTTNWFSKIIVPAGWGIAAVIGFVLLNWAIRSLALPEQINAGTSNTNVPFETQVRQGDICEGPLAVAHGYSVALTNENKTAFLPVDTENTIDETRSFAWSADGKQLAILGNTTGNGNIYITVSSGTSLQPVLSNSELGYLFDFAWSRDGKRFITWSSQNNKKIYLLNSDGTGLVEKQLDTQILGAPQFWPDGSSVVFYGATPTTAGLFELYFVDLGISQIKSDVEGAGSFSFSPDGAHLSYMEYDRDFGEARLLSEDLTTRQYEILGSLPIPKGSGSSVPETANLSWSQDGKKLVFEFGRNATDRAIYLAYADGSGMVKVAGSAHAPTISSDGKCLAYLRGQQVFVLDLNKILPTSQSAGPFLLTNLPDVKGTADLRLDKLQWRP